LNAPRKDEKYEKLLIG